MNTPSARETAPGGRFFFFALLSVVLMYFDQRDGWGQRIRYALQAIAYPIQVTVGSPARLASATSEMFRTRASLREENEALRSREQELLLRTQRFEALERENEQLRNLAAGELPALVEKSVLADVVMAEITRQRQWLVINKGATSGLFRYQSVVDADGLVGQLVRVGPWSAEVMLISDPGAAVPVEVVRSGVRTIAEGTGSDEPELHLPYVAATDDVKVGDLIVTSGLGGVFPTGIPVGVVTEYLRDPDELLAVVRVQPSARLARSRQLLALWFSPDNPAAPRRPGTLETLPPATLGDPIAREPAPRPTPARTTAPTPAPPPAPPPTTPAPAPAPTPTPAPAPAPAPDPPPAPAPAPDPAAEPAPAQADAPAEPTEPGQ